MKTLVQTIIVFVGLSLLTAGSVPAQDVAEQEIHKALDTQAKVADLAQREAEFAAKLAQKQVEAAQKQVEAARKQMQASLRQVAVAQQNLPTIPEPLPPVPPIGRMSTGFASGWASRSGSTGTVLVIPAAEFKTEDILTISDDINVMSRIFEKNLQQAHIAPVGTRLFISSDDVFRTFFGGGGGAIQTMYLQGYGALFLMKVDFPLSPPLQVEEEEKETKEEEADPVWERTKREMYEPEGARRHRDDQPEQKYDPEKVQNLKTTLVKTLKHAANIRILKPEESVILAITGSGSYAGGITAIATAEIVGHEDHNTRIVEELAPRGSSPAMLVIRAKKSDIDDFAKADLDLDQFRQRTQMFTCPHLGGGTKRGDLFGDYFRRARR